MDSTNVLLILFGVAVIGVVIYLLVSSNTSSSPASSAPATTLEHFDIPSPADATMTGSSEDGSYGVDASEDIRYVESPQGLQQTDSAAFNQMPSECYPKEVLSSADLLPRDANSLWAQVSPSGQGSLADQNFLTAGYHIGINTVGQTLRNANRQLRSEPPNPQVSVSPWNQTTIEPDINRQPLEIGQGSA